LRSARCRRRCDSDIVDAVAERTRRPEVGAEIRAVHGVFHTGIPRPLPAHRLLRPGQRPWIDAAARQDPDGVRVRIATDTQKRNFDRRVTLIAVVRAVRVPHESGEKFRRKTVRRSNDERLEIDEALFDECVFGITIRQECAAAARAFGAGLDHARARTVGGHHDDKEMAAEILFEMITLRGNRGEHERDARRLDIDQRPHGGAAHESDGMRREIPAIGHRNVAAVEDRILVLRSRL